MTIGVEMDPLPPEDPSQSNTVAAWVVALLALALIALPDLLGNRGPARPLGAIDVGVPGAAVATPAQRQKTDEDAGSPLDSDDREGDSVDRDAASRIPAAGERGQNRNGASGGRTP